MHPLNKLRLKYGSTPPLSLPQAQNSHMSREDKHDKAKGLVDSLVKGTVSYIGGSSELPPYVYQFGPEGTSMKRPEWDMRYYASVVGISGLRPFKPHRTVGLPST